MADVDARPRPSHAPEPGFLTAHGCLVKHDRITVTLLADSPGALPTLQTWFEAEWPDWYGPGGPGNAAADLRRSSNRRIAPIALVAWLDGTLCGTAALKAQSIASHRHLSPWLAGLLVGRRFRRKGVGGRLVDEIERLAAGLGYPRIYCATTTAGSLLARRGWHRLPRIGQEREGVWVKSLERTTAPPNGPSPSSRDRPRSMP